MDEFSKVKYGLLPQDDGPSSRDMVNHPKHYTHFSMEVKDMMIAIWGAEAFSKYCEMNAFKYRMRAGLKDDAMQDLQKARVYEDWARKYRTV